MPWNRRTTRRDRKRERRRRAREKVESYRMYSALLDEACREAAVRSHRLWLEWETALAPYRNFLAQHVDLAEPFITGGESDAMEP